MHHKIKYFGLNLKTKGASEQTMGVHQGRHKSAVLGGVALLLLALGSIAYFYESSIDYHTLENFRRSSSNQQTAHKRILMGGTVSQKVHTRDVIFKKAAVATDNPECSKVGRDTLKKGGSAVDAAIASLLCLGVINAHSTGIGGGGFMIVYLKKAQKATVIDFRETAPKKADKDLFGGDPKKGIRGGLAVAIPGELRGMEMAHKKFGKLPWKQLFQPAIKIARDGFNISDSLHIAINKWKNDVLNDTCLSKIYAKDGKILPTGTFIKNKALANTLKKVAEKGADAFYTGKLAKTFAKEVKRHGGIVSAEDMQNYKAIIREPLQSALGEYTMLNAPPPASGPTLAYILNILKGFNMTEDFSQQNPSVTYHRMIEAFKFAYARRTELADPDVEKSVWKVVKELMDEKFAEKTRLKMDDDRTFNVSHYGGKYTNKVTTGTTHMVVVAPNGDAVTVMSTVNGYLGAKFRSCKLGLVYNNEMDDFSTPGVANQFGLPPSRENFIAPGKRPMSSSVPVIVLDENMNVRLAAGGSGGSIITTAVAQVIMNHLWFGMSIKDSIQQPRVHAQLIPETVYVEPRMPSNIVNELIEKGHNVSVTDESHAVVQGIVRVDNQLMTICKKGSISGTLCEKVKKYQDAVLFAESDFRKGGTPAGY